MSRRRPINFKPAVGLQVRSLDVEDALATGEITTVTPSGGYRVRWEDSETWCHERSNVIALRPMLPEPATSQYAILQDSKADHQRQVAAARRAFARVGRDEPVLLYRFLATGEWDWAIPNSPIAVQLSLTGEAYPGAPVDRFYRIERLS